MFITKVLINFTTHHSHVTVDERGFIHVFKYTNSTCDWDMFQDNEQFAASDFILTPPKSIVYRVTFPGEEDTPY